MTETLHMSFPIPQPGRITVTLLPERMTLHLPVRGYQPYEYQAVISDWNTLLTEDVQLVKEEIDYPIPRNQDC